MPPNMACSSTRYASYVYVPLRYLTDAWSIVLHVPEAVSVNVGLKQTYVYKYSRTALCNDRRGGGIQVNIKVI